MGELRAGARGLAWPFALLLFVVMAVAACGGSDGPTGYSGIRGPDGTPTIVDENDTDADGIGNETDMCPNKAEKEGGPDADAGDGCPDTIEDYVTFAIVDIATYWDRRARNFALRYVSPEFVTPYTETEPIDTPCGPSEPGNAFYCLLDHSIYYDKNLLASELATRGDFAPIFILAHEWGHVVQANLGFLFAPFLSVELELQADCLAGVYTKNADDRKLLDLGDLDEAVATLLTVGDDSDVAWYDPGAHGTGEQRVAAFRKGYSEGLGVCASQSPVPKP